MTAIWVVNSASGIGGAKLERTAKKWPAKVKVRLHLKGLEDKKVRAGYGDARAHAILNCASISCPRLRRRAVEPETLEADLDEAMAELVSHPKHFQLDESAGVVCLSRIFDWFEGDFLEDERRGNERLG